jgi:ribosomal protein S18 acetylase RimI-like enzyme
MTSNIAVVPLTAKKIRDAVSMLSRAFWDYPESVHLSNSEFRRRRVLPAYMADECRTAVGCESGLMAVSGAEVRGALYMRPESYPVPWRQEVSQAIRLSPTLPWTATSLPEILRNRTAQRAGHPKEPHFYIKVLGTDPEVQGSGIGSALLTHVVARADAAGLGCYLTTATKENVTWYARFGFGVTEEFNPTRTWPRVWRLWRDPPG